jgi:hypothetical protein
MLPYQTVERCLAGLSKEFQDIVLELRNLVAIIAPGVTETAHNKGFSYYYARLGGPVSAGVCQIGIYPDHVRLAFNHGVFLPDPEGLLRGEEKVKRYVSLATFENTPWDALEELIRASLRFNPRTLKFDRAKP